MFELPHPCLSTGATKSAQLDPHKALSLKVNLVSDRARSASGEMASDLYFRPGEMANLPRQPNGAHTATVSDLKPFPDRARRKDTHNHHHPLGRRGVERNKQIADRPPP